MSVHLWIRADGRPKAVSSTVLEPGRGGYVVTVMTARTSDEARATVELAAQSDLPAPGELAANRKLTAAQRLDHASAWSSQQVARASLAGDDVPAALALYRTRKE